MIHNLMTFNETIVAAASSHALLSVHAASHKNGSLSIMLINKDPKNTATVKVTVNGGKLAGPGMRFDYGRSNPAGEKAVSAVQVEDVGNSFTLTVPSYTITDVLIPQSH
jgi:hypothetical protein